MNRRDDARRGTYEHQRTLTVNRYLFIAEERKTSHFLNQGYFVAALLRNENEQLSGCSCCRSFFMSETIEIFPIVKDFADCPFNELLYSSLERLQCFLTQIQNFRVDARDLLIRILELKKFSSSFRQSRDNESTH